MKSSRPAHLGHTNGSSRQNATELEREPESPVEKTPNLKYPVPFPRMFLLRTEGVPQTKRGSAWGIPHRNEKPKDEAAADLLRRRLGLPRVARHSVRLLGSTDTCPAQGYTLKRRPKLSYADAKVHRTAKSVELPHLTAPCMRPGRLILRTPSLMQSTALQQIRTITRPAQSGCASLSAALKRGPTNADMKHIARKCDRATHAAQR